MERTIREWIIYFTLYSVIGWLYEVFLEVVVYRWGYSDRGVLMGPYCIIYGVGALLLVTLLSPLMKKDLRLGKVPVTPLAVFLANEPAPEDVPAPWRVVAVRDYAAPQAASGRRWFWAMQAGSEQERQA